MNQPQTVANPLPACTEAARAALAVLTLVYLLLSAYVEPPFDIGSGRILPAFTTVFVVPVALLALCSVIYRRDLLMLFSVGALLFLSAVLSPGREWVGEKLLGMAQTVTAISAGLVLFKVAEMLPISALRRVLLGAWLALLIGAGLEVSGALRPAVVAFGRAVYHAGGYEFYSADVRDLGLLGFVRPKVFTSEPSLVSIAFYLFVTGWLALKPTLRRFTIAFAATTVMIALLGSPVLLIAFAVLCMVFATLSIRSFDTALPAVGLLLVLVLSLPLLLPGMATLLSDRAHEALDNSRSYAVTSENLRIVFPAIATADVIA